MGAEGDLPMIVRVMVSEARARFVSGSTELAVERLLDGIVRRRVLHSSAALGGRRGSVGRLKGPKQRS